MIKQIYRFLSITLILNLAFIPAGIAKTLGNNDKVPENICQDKNESDKTSDDKPLEYKDPYLENMPPYSSQNFGEYTTLYGVQSLDDLYNSYPGITPKSRKKGE